jgi:propanediol dehydratase small subunit
MPTITIDETEISSVDGNFETIREEFNRLATDSLATRYDISVSFINDDGSFTDTGKELLFEEIGRDELLTTVGNLQKLRGTKEAQQLEDEIATEAGSETGGVSFDQARELQQQRLEEQREQAKQQARSRRASTTPKLQEVDGDDNVVRELAPDFVSAFGGTLPFDTDSTQLQDGQTVTDQNGDQNIRLNMEMVLTGGQLATLQQMRQSGNQLNVVSVGYSGKATFDEIKFDHIPDENGRITADGQRIDDATFTVQLQSKESDEDDTVMQPFEAEE